MKTKYSIEHENLGEDSKYEPRYCEAFLSSEGDNFDELIDNAEYFFIDQDGGEIGSAKADDTRAFKFIKEWFAEHGECESLEDRKNAELERWAGDK